MKVILEPGDTLVIELAGADGKFAVVYGDDAFTIVADETDSDGRGDTIYSDRFGEAADRLLHEDSPTHD